MNIGDKVKVTKMPADLPNDDRVRTLFKRSLGKIFTIAAIDDNLYELHVGAAFGDAPDKHRIWIDADHLKKIES